MSELKKWVDDVTDFLYPIAHEESVRGVLAEGLGQFTPKARAMLTQASSDVLDERRRQVEKEGWTPEHDDEHHDGSMAYAAACYALHTEPVGNVGDYLRFWPWDAEWWKPKDRRSNLVRAGALILAEIERLDRATTQEP